MKPLLQEIVNQRYTATETIPFNETRTYVKNVLSNANYYSSVLNGQTQSLKQRLGVITPKAASQSELP